MKLWTKLLVVLLTLAMVLSLAACGEKDPEETPAQSKPATTTPAETTPEETPDESTPEASQPDESTPAETTPAETPDESTPEASQPDETPAESTPAASQPDETPAETTPAETVDPDRPKIPTMEDGYMDGDAENWLFKIDQSTETFTIDGELEKAYYDGIYLVGDISKPASDSNFDVFITADSEYIYVFYEFTKVEGIFWDDSYDTSKRYHFDCVDFCLNLAGTRSVGTEFRIYAGVEGGMDAEGYFNGGAAGAGVSELYVKHTDKGYNVEFAIDMELVTGADDDGNKMISFTALSTITTAWEDKSAAPTRVYTVACKAAGAEAKNEPTYLVINGTAPEGYTKVEYEMTDDGRYAFTLNAATEALVQDGEKDAAYDTGLHFTDAHYNGNNVQNAVGLIKDEKNSYDVYVAADAQYIYVLAIIKDDAIISNCEKTHHNDCIELYVNTKGNGGGYSGEGATSMRIWAEGEGTDVYKNETAGQFTSHTPEQAAAATTNIAVLNSYTIKKTTDGYNVEFTLKRSEIEGGNVFGFLPVVTMAVDTQQRAYVYSENSLNIGNDTAKTVLNHITIVDPTPAA